MENIQYNYKTEGLVVGTKPTNGIVVTNDTKVEGWFSMKFDDIVKTSIDKFPDKIFYSKKEEKHIFEYNTIDKNFFVDYDTIWKVLNKKYGLNRIYIENFITTEASRRLSIDIVASSSFEFV